MSFIYGQDVPFLPIEQLKAASQKNQAPAPPQSPLAALAAKMPPPKSSATNISISGPAEGSIVWNADRSYWREKNSPNWRPAKEYSYAPAVEKKTTTVKK